MVDSLVVRWAVWWVVASVELKVGNLVDLRVDETAAEMVEKKVAW